MSDPHRHQAKKTVKYPALLLSLLMMTPWGLVAIAGTAVAVGSKSCTASDQTNRTCSFTCVKDDTITVRGTNQNEDWGQTFAASCGGASASCTAKASKMCGFQ